MDHWLIIFPSSNRMPRPSPTRSMDLVVKTSGSSGATFADWKNDREQGDAMVISWRYHWESAESNLFLGRKIFLVFLGS